MIRRIFRVCRTIHARLDGEGARRVGARWNSPGHAVVYMAESVSLAILENLVHMSREDFPAGYVAVGAAIPAKVQILFEDELRETYGNQSPNALGDLWVRSMQTSGTPSALRYRAQRMQLSAESTAPRFRRNRGGITDPVSIR